MKQPKISVIIATWNGQSYIEHCLDSVFAQSVPENFKDNTKESYPFFEVLVIDNGSDDNTLKIIKEKYEDKVNIVKNKTNQGFARGYNQGMHWTSGRYLLILNQDVVLDKNYLKETASFLDAYPKVAAVNGKVYQWNFANKIKTDIFDSLGIDINKNFQFTNIEENKKDEGQESEIRSIFGFTASVALIRRAALLDVEYNKEFFDEDFFSYKEDIDLSYRFRWRNWDNVYLPTAVAYHKRSIKEGDDARANIAVAKNYKQKPKFINYLSYRNHLYLMHKNIGINFFINNLFYIIWYELKKIIYLLFTHPKTLTAWLEFIRNRSKLREKRKYIKNNRKINPKGINLWIK